VHKRTDSHRGACQHWNPPFNFGDTHMLFTIGIGIVLLAVAILHRMGVPQSGVSSASLGWMSERWLAEHRASHLQ